MREHHLARVLRLTVVVLVPSVAIGCASSEAKTGPRVPHVLSVVACEWADELPTAVYRQGNGTDSAVRYRFVVSFKESQASRVVFDHASRSITVAAHSYSNVTLQGRPAPKERREHPNLGCTLREPEHQAVGETTSGSP